MFNTCFRCENKTENGALFCDGCKNHLKGFHGTVVKAEIVKTRFYKNAGKCYAVFLDEKGFVSYQVSEMVYKEFQKWVKKEMTPTGSKGTYQSGVPTQTRIKNMLKDHMDFPF